MRWVCQSNLGCQNNVNSIKYACDKNGFDFESVKVIPFSDELPCIDNDQSTVFYGSINLINKVYKSNKWHPGVFFFEDNFNYLAWGKYYKEHLLNYDFIPMKMKEVEKIKEGHYFIRPQSDNKEIAGTVMKSTDIKEWLGKIIVDDNVDMLELPILVAKPKLIEIEWRLFVVNGKVSSGSQYRTYGVLNTDSNIPGNVIDFAERTILSLYRPHNIFVLDIGKLDSDKDLKVIEVGCFNSAGFYESDIEKIIVDISKSVNRYV